MGLPGRWMKLPPLWMYPGRPKTKGKVLPLCEGSASGNWSSEMTLDGGIKGASVGASTCPNVAWMTVGRSGSP